MAGEKDDFQVKVPSCGVDVDCLVRPERYVVRGVQTFSPDSPDSFISDGAGSFGVDDQSVVVRRANSYMTPGEPAMLPLSSELGEPELGPGGLQQMRIILDAIGPGAMSAITHTRMPTNVEARLPGIISDGQLADAIKAGAEHLVQSAVFLDRNGGRDRLVVRPHGTIALDQGAEGVIEDPEKGNG